MSQNPNAAPLLFDRSALTAHRTRANAADLFLHEQAVFEVQDRLSLVNRTFTKPAIVTAFAAPWHAAFPEARIVRDDDTLDLSQGAHDLVVHTMGLHWANDPVGQLIQCRRALQEDGFLLTLLLGGQTLTELRAVLGQAESEITGGLSPRIAPMGELRDLGGLLQRAGFALPVADSVPLTVEYRDLWHLMRDLRAMGETNAMADRLRRPTRRDVFTRAAQLYADHFVAPSGKIQATFEIVCLTGWAPSDSQPKPLRPGSAQTRLAQALGTTETKMSD